MTKLVEAWAPKAKLKKLKEILETNELTEARRALIATWLANRLTHFDIRAFEHELDSATYVDGELRVASINEMKN